jgi:hypothetical protein
MKQPPGYGAPPPNYAMKEITHLSGNPIHTAHELKAFTPQKFKPKGLTPSQDNAPGAGSPWLQMLKGSK